MARCPSCLTDEAANSHELTASPQRQGITPGTVDFKRVKRLVDGKRPASQQQLRISVQKIPLRLLNVASCNPPPTVNKQILSEQFSGTLSVIGRTDPMSPPEDLAPPIAPVEFINGMNDLMEEATHQVTLVTLPDLFWSTIALAQASHNANISSICEEGLRDG
ncbi:hypothetical protein AAG570_001912 [Ranatra chinensis]|uniref:Uncharacterized protein n=1 Tax=Ranatra chinensis TaxID=642074 RepID=A0ABD0YA56_9HEMI